MFVGGDGGGDGLDPCVHFLLDGKRHRLELVKMGEHAMFGSLRAAPLTRFTVIRASLRSGDGCSLASQMSSGLWHPQATLGFSLHTYRS